MKSRKTWMLERIRTRHISQAAAMAKAHTKKKKAAARTVTLERLATSYQNWKVRKNEQ